MAKYDMALFSNHLTIQPFNHLAIQPFNHLTMHPHHHPHHPAVSNITVAFFLNLSFTIIEIIGGVLTNSLAILSDAIHDLGDTVALGFSWYMEKVSARKRDQRFSYGYKRFSLLAALINGVALAAGSLLILREAFPRLAAPEPVHAPGMLALAILGILVNGTAAWRLRRGKTMNEKVVSWHLLEDVLGWAAVLLISIVMLFREIPILDPLFSVLFSLYILWNVLKNLKQTMMIFLQSTPREIDIREIEKKIAALPGVNEVHDTHLWTMDGEFHVLTAHVVVEADMSKENIILLKRRIREVIGGFEIQHATLEIERAGEECYLRDC